MFLARFLAPFFGGSSENEPDSFNKALNRTNTALLQGKDKEKDNAMSVLLKFSHSSTDLSFIGYSLSPLLASTDLYTRIIGFRAVSLFLTPSSPSVEMLPTVMRRSFQYQDLLVPALNALTYIMNPFVFHHLKKDIIDLATNSDDLPRILAMICVYKAYKQDKKNLKHLFLRAMH